MTSLEIFENYIKKFSDGNCMHFSILQPGMQYFRHEFGLISYIKKYGCHFVLTDPLFKYSDRKSRIELIEQFLKNFKRVSFIQTSKELAELLHEKFHYFSTQIGNERLIDIQNWKISGKRKQVIRTACNQASIKGIDIKENALENDFNSISTKWLNTRQVKEREIKFLIRKHPYFEIDTRVFCAYDREKKLLAYVIFSPIFENGKCVGYVPDISRSSPEFKQGTYYAIIVKAIKQFKEEGLKYLNLGLSPLILKEDSYSYESESLRYVLKLIRKYGSSFYNYDGINYTKSRFVNESSIITDGKIRPVFFCHKTSLPLIKVTAVFKASNVI